MASCSKHTPKMLKHKGTESDLLLTASLGRPMGSAAAPPAFHSLAHFIQQPVTLGAPWSPCGRTAAEPALETPKGR